MFKNGNNIAIIITHTTHHITKIITGSIAAERFFILLSSSFVYLIDIFCNIFDKVHVCSQIFIDVTNSIGNASFFIFNLSKLFLFHKIALLKGFQFLISSNILYISFL
jgi:hypothetical protein